MNDAPADALHGNRRGPEVMDMHGLEPLRLLFLFPLARIVMVVAIVGIIFWYTARQKELKFHQELRIREMEHQQKMKELEVEKAKLELEKARAGKSA